MRSISVIGVDSAFRILLHFPHRLRYERCTFVAITISRVTERKKIFKRKSQRVRLYLVASETTHNVKVNSVSTNVVE